MLLLFKDIILHANDAALMHEQGCDQLDCYYVESYFAWVASLMDGDGLQTDYRVVAEVVQGNMLTIDDAGKRPRCEDINWNTS